MFIPSNSFMRHSLSSNWFWRLSSTNDDDIAKSRPELQSWTPVSAFPSVIQTELMHQKLIPDPYIGENERQVQWVGKADWEYCCFFQTPANFAENQHVEMVFDGLDTFATVTLNGRVILSSNNMFLPARVPVKDLLKSGLDNTLSILFESALKVGSELEQKHGVKKSNMRDSRRMHMRKAQYHWGWDWGPIVVTCGPYMPIHLEAFTSRIDNLQIVSGLVPDHSTSDVSITVQVSSVLPEAALKIALLDASNEVVETATAPVNREGNAVLAFKIHSPKLWWPNGQGEQHLYTARATLLDSNSHVLHQTSSRFGVRTIELIQRPLSEAPGTTFMFRVNGRDIFIQGGDWIPADQFLPNISRDRYFKWIEMGKRSHLNAIRVWGGGTYEMDDFWDACDEMGMLVWLDYAFACGDYPVYDGLMHNIKKEAEAQTIRLRNRASLALLCGGNEDFMLMDEWQKIPYDHDDEKGPFEDTPFPARKIYLTILPEVAGRLAPNIPYWANSPYGGKLANDPTVGDIHQWNVWHGEQAPYQEYRNLSGRFVSEFGMHGFPVNRTVEYFCQGAPKEELHAQSRLIDCHNKGHGAHTRIARYLAENFRFDMTSLKNFIYASQLMQSEAYGYALRQWKRKFNGEGYEECAGAIIWQLNDVYPCTSWAYVDYFLRPKPAFYTIRRSFAPVSLGVDRTPSTLWVDEDAPRDTNVPKFDMWAHNTMPSDVKATLFIRAYDFSTGDWTELDSNQAKKAVVLKAGRNNELGKLDSCPLWKENSLIILELVLRDAESGAQLARLVDWPEPYRYLYWPRNTKITLSIATGFTDGAGTTWDNTVMVSSNQPLKGVWLQPVYDGSEAADSEEPEWEDNMFDLLPGQEITVGVNGLSGREVGARYLADWEAEKP